MCIIDLQLYYICRAAAWTLWYLLALFCDGNISFHNELRKTRLGDLQLTNSVTLGLHFWASAFTNVDRITDLTGVFQGLENEIFIYGRTVEMKILTDWSLMLPLKNNFRYVPLISYFHVSKNSMFYCFSKILEMTTWTKQIEFSVI